MNEEKWYKFIAYNSQPLYGYGTEAEAEAFVDHLNKGREINLYQYEVAKQSDAELSDCWGNLKDELVAIAEAE